MEDTGTNPAHGHPCPFCHRVYGRADGARRHAKSCPARGDRPLPPFAKRGRKLRACEECARIKVFCDGKVPCQRCFSRNLVCTFERLGSDPAHRGRSTRDEENPCLRQTSHPLRFLLNCTDPKVNFVNDVMVSAEPESDPAIPAAWNQPSPGYDTINPQLLFLGFMDPYLDIPLDFDGMNGSGSPGNILSAPYSAPNDTLAAAVSLLRADLQQLISIRPDLDGLFSYSSFDEFFTCANFERLLMVFFRRRQLLARMIHWPTFDPAKVDLGLLFAIALCGIAYSYRSAESLNFASIAASLQRLGDKYIFRRLKQCRGRPNSRSELEVCQAAYLITILQISGSGGDTRRRAIVKRQPALIDSLRRLGIMDRIAQSVSNADWQDFVYKESCVKLVAFATFNDCLLTLFFNSPPSMMVSEMCGDLPCRNELWDANGEESFHAEQNNAGPHLRSPCMKELLSGLLNDEWNDTTTSTYKSLSVFHLYSAIGAFQLILFNYRANMFPKSLGSVLLRALTRWEQLWDAAMQRIAPEDQKWLGVARYSSEFALISRRIVEIGGTDGGHRSRYLRCTPEYDLSVFHEFILEHGTAGVAPEPTLRDGSRIDRHR